METLNIFKAEYPFYKYICGVTGLTCCGCSLFCEHREEKRKEDRAIQEKIDEIVQSLEYLLETDPRSFSNPYCEDEHVYHAIAEAIRILKSIPN